MLQALRTWSEWQGRKVHPLRLVVELLISVWALWPLLLLLYVFASRLFYPIDLEWMEGGSLYQAYRLLHGLPLYVHDPASFAPYPYPPVHTLILAVVGLIRLDFWTGRLVSMGFFLLVCIVFFKEISSQHRGSSFGVAASLLAIAVIACGYPELGQWYDLIRVDMTMLGLLIWGCARALKLSPNFRHQLTTAAILTLAIYAKQTAAVFVLWACVFSLTRVPRIGLRLSTLVGVMSLTTLVALNVATHGGFQHLVISNPGQHEIRGPVVVEGLEMILRYAPFVAVVPFASLLITLRGMLSPRTIFWVGCLLLSIPASVVPYAKVGAYLNALLPAFIFAGPATVMLLGDLANQIGVVGALARYSTLAGFSIFAAIHPLAPSKYLPGPEKWQAARELNAMVEGLSGGLVVPYLGFLPARNGHTNLHWHSMAVWDSIWRNEPLDEVRCLQTSKARWVLLHSKDIGEFANYVRRHSRLNRRLPDSARVRMVTGAAVEVDELWDRGLSAERTR